ncbi:hypothetical protein [Goodfellowiella coeruleoviolacea]|nr:hypothetical protein [Goodfellowiella coeruleoviolacea]
MSEAPGVASSTYPCSIVAKSPNINVRKEPTTKSQVVSVMRYGDVWAAYCDLVPGENIAVCGSAAHNLWVRVPIGFVHKECVYWVQVPTP